MAYILHIETATKACSVALSLNGECIAVKESVDENYSHGENLTLFIEDVFKQANIKPKDLSAVSVTSGPGSYTGLRIGVSTAKGLCYALEIPLISIDALLNLAAIAQIKFPNQNLCALIDARRMEVYNCIYNSQLQPQKEITADIIEENSYESHLPFVCFGDGAEKLQEVWNGRAIQFDTEIYSSATGHATIAFAKFQTKEFEDLAYFEPFYLKDFVAGKPKKA